MAETIPFYARDQSEKIQSLGRNDLCKSEAREVYYGQVHRPATKKFRLSYYESSFEWTTVEEFFLLPPLDQSSAPPLKWFDWVGGVYKVKTSTRASPDRNLDNQVEIFLCFDFSGQALFGKNEMIQWAIKTSSKLGPSSVAYPGLHHGSMTLWNHLEIVNEVLWQTPIFSPYMELKLPDRYYERPLELEPVSFETKVSRRSQQSTESVMQKVDLYKTRGFVVILQEFLKDIAQLLVYGPTYDKMSGEIRLRIETDAYHISEATTKLFEGYLGAEAASFFSRAYCCAVSPDDKTRPAQDKQVQWTIKIVEDLFEHYKILREPLWLRPSQDDFVDDLYEEAKAIKTVSDWRAFERKWATIVSYCCKLHLHEGPWAGDDWMVCVETSI